MAHWLVRFRYALKFGVALLGVTNLSFASPTIKNDESANSDAQPGARGPARSPSTTDAAEQPRVQQNAEDLPGPARALHDALRDGGELPVAGSAVGLRIASDGSLAVVGPHAGPWARAQRAVQNGGQLVLDETTTLFIYEGSISEAKISVAGTRYVLEPRGSKPRVVRIHREGAGPVGPLAGAKAVVEVPLTSISESAPKAKAETARATVTQVKTEYVRLAEIESRLGELERESKALGRAAPPGDTRLQQAQARLAALRGELGTLCHRSAELLVRAERTVQVLDRKEEPSSGQPRPTAALASEPPR